MIFHSLDYMYFLGLAVLGFWGLARYRRFGLLAVLLFGAGYLGNAWNGLYAAPILGLLTLDFVLQKNHSWKRRRDAFFARRHAARLTLVFILSCAFYMAWQAKYIWLILGSTFLDYIVGYQLGRVQKKRLRQLLLLMSLTGNLGLLFTFKYYNFFAAQLSELLTGAGLATSLPLLDVALPVGISFYTFQTLSYTIDIYRGKLKPARDFVTFAAFVTYFPQLVAGPIVRASELLPQLEAKPTLSRAQISDGIFLIATGLIKKLAIADYLALGIVDRVFDDPAKFTSAEVVVALYAFTMQLYCDFSGYTDIARGSAKLMGLELPRNFERPYQATNPGDFWRRWHMTLSRWLRDYLYFPLGGSRGSVPRAYFNLFLTMFLVGIWHGSWRNFEVFFWYALLQSAAMVTHRFVTKGWLSSDALRKRKLERSEAAKKVSANASKARWMTAAMIFLNLQFVVFSRILFRAGAEDKPTETSWAILERLEELSLHTVQVPWSMWTLLFVTFGLHFLPSRHFEQIRVSFRRVPPVWKGVLLGGVALLLLEVGSREALPFQYFQF